ncbi:MAG: hypothetical protein WAW23_12355 [Candidatus Methanoperedens sp.]
MRKMLTDLLKELNKAYSNSIPIRTLIENGHEITVIKDAIKGELVERITIPSLVDEPNLNNKEMALKISIKGEEFLENSKHDKTIFANPWIKYIIIPLVVTIIAGLVILYFPGERGTNPIFQNSNRTTIITDSPNSSVDNSITINNLTIVTDKEALGIREKDGLYQNGTKVGRVINFVPNEKESTFTITEIDFDQPIRNQDTVWQPYEYQNYVIKIQNIENLVTIAPPGAEGVSGIILDKLKNNG